MGPTINIALFPSSASSLSLPFALNNTDKFSQLEQAPLLTFAASCATLRKYLAQFFILNDSQNEGEECEEGQAEGSEAQRAAEGRRKVAQIKIAGKAVKTALNSRQLRSIFIAQCWSQGAVDEEVDEGEESRGGEGRMWRMYTRLQHIFGAAGSGTQA